MTSPRIEIIAALARNRVIGRDNALPWRLSDDLRHFKRLTLHKPILMGRKTWESLPGLLPERPHIVLTRQSGYRADGCRVVQGIEQALVAAGDAEVLMLVGGANLYAQLLPRASRLHLTRVEAEPEGDAFFPQWDESAWQLVERESHRADARNDHDYHFETWQRAGD